MKPKIPQYYQKMLHYHISGEGFNSVSEIDTDDKQEPDSMNENKTFSGILQ